MIGFAPISLFDKISLMNIIPIFPTKQIVVSFVRAFLGVVNKYIKVIFFFS